MLPQVNASLLSITRESSATGGYSEDYDRASTPGTPVWHGTADAYVQRRVRSTFDGNGVLQRVLDVTLYIDEYIDSGIQPGDLLTYQAGDADSSTTFAGYAQNLVDPAMMATVQDYFKVSLEETNVPKGAEG